MSNVSILPGEEPLSFEELIASTDDGIYMETNKTWQLLRNSSYSGITTEFWNSMDAICDRRYWTLWGTPNCGKGQPEQGMGTGHGAAPARFLNVKVGGAYGN
jgi:TldD protein